MANQPSRRRLQFRLRTLMFGVTLLAVPLGYVGWQAKIVSERKAMLDDAHVLVEAPIGGVKRSGTIPWIRRYLGDEAVDWIITVDEFTDTEIERYRVAFPEAHVCRDEELNLPHWIEVAHSGH